MVKKGRKPLPNKLKVLRGNPGRRSLPEREPQPDQGAPMPVPSIYSIRIAILAVSGSLEITHSVTSALR